MKNKNPSVDRYIFNLEPNQALIADILREILLSKYKELQEVYKYNCPFYEYNGPICYINFEKKSKKLIIGFYYGNKLKDKYNALSNDTKQIRKLYFNSIDDIDEEKLDYYIAQSINMNSIKKK